MQNSSKHFNNQADCAHAWAHQLYTEGKTSNFYFDGSVIYSYGEHFPIAVQDGHNVFFTLQSYSPTTAQHKSIVLAAISHKNVIYVEELPSNGNASNDFFKNRNISCWIAQIEMALNDYERHPRRKSLLSKADTALSRLTRFIEALGITPDETLQQLLTAPSIQNLQQFKQERERKQWQRERNKIAQAKKKYTKNIAEWKAEQIRTFDHSGPGIDSNLAYLRLRADDTVIETSKGIKVPTEAGRTLWQVVQQVLTGDIQNYSRHIEGYKVTGISGQFLTVGCHKIPMTEVTEIVSRLGW